MMFATAYAIPTWVVAAVAIGIVYVLWLLLRGRNAR